MAPIPQHLLILSGPFGPRVTAGAAAGAIARGLQSAGRPAPDCCPIEADWEHARDVRALLDGLDFDARMKAARALVIACERLRERALAGSIAFEAATRARQSGVPAYAIAAVNQLDSFDARILDLQLVLSARGPKPLQAAGAELAEIA